MWSITYISTLEYFNPFCMKSSEQQRSSKLRSLYGSDASSLCAETCFGEQTAFSFFGTDM